MAELVPACARPYLAPMSANGDTLPRIEWVDGNWCFAFLGDEEEAGSVTFTLPVEESAVSLNFSAVGSFGQTIRVSLSPAAGGAPFFSQNFTGQPSAPVAIPIAAENQGEVRMTVTGLGGSPTRIKNLSLQQ